MSGRRNGYGPSILSTTPGVCYICGRRGDTARHEIFYGTANRKNSKAEGLWINVCPDCHADIHAGKWPRLKMLGQRVFERRRTREEFVRIFGRSYVYD